jgi:hypothetical protein
MDPDQTVRHYVRKYPINIQTGSMLVANPFCWFCRDAAQILLIIYCLFFITDVFLIEKK